MTRMPTGCCPAVRRARCSSGRRETADEARRRDAVARFNDADRNRDGRIARDEWTGNAHSSRWIRIGMGSSPAPSLPPRSAIGPRPHRASGFRRLRTSRGTMGHSRGSSEGKGDRSTRRRPLGSRSAGRARTRRFGLRSALRLVGKSIRPAIAPGSASGTRRDSGLVTRSPPHTRRVTTRGLSEGRQAGKDDRNMNGGRLGTSKGSGSWNRPIRATTRASARATSIRPDIAPGSASDTRREFDPVADTFGSGQGKHGESFYL